MPFKRDHFNRIRARLEQLESYTRFAQRTLQQRKLRYEEWKRYKPKRAFSTIGRILKSPPAPTESDMVSAYSQAGESRNPLVRWSLLIHPKDIQVRRHLSKVDVARCSFKDKAVEEVRVNSS